MKDGGEGYKYGYSQRLEKRVGYERERLQELRQQRSLQMERVLLNGPDAPEIVVNEVMQRAAGAVPAKIQEMIGNILTAYPDMPRDMVEHPELLAVPDTARREEFALRVMYRMQGGRFYPDDDNEHIRASFNDILRALKDPTRVAQEREDSIALTEANSGDGAGLANAIRRLEKALEISSSLRPSIAQLVPLVNYLMSLKDPQTGGTVQDCIRERVIMARWMPAASARVEQRLARSITGIKRNDSMTRFEAVTLNSIGEYFLVRLGVLSPDLFARIGGSTSPRSEGEGALEELGYSRAMIRIMLGERSQTGLFWHRWKTTGVKPGALTDLAVRDFLTKKLRVDREEILNACYYPDFFASAQALAGDLRDEKNIPERDRIARLIEIEAMEMLGGYSLQDCLQRLAKKSWYADLDTLTGKF